MLSTCRLIVAALIIIFVVTSCTAINAQTERITNFQSFISIHKDRTITVTENIQVIAAGREIRRGIYRTFPTRYKDRFGNRVRVDFKIIEVKKNAMPEPYHTVNMSNGIKLYIGSRNVYLRPGSYTYTIVYQTNRQIGFFEDFDEFYWNVTGLDWGFPIERVEAIVQLPPGARIINKIAYTGRKGEKGTNYSISRNARGEVQFSTTSPLKPGEGLTIAVSWQKGVIPEPKIEEKISNLFLDNKNSMAGLIGIFVLLLYYLMVWSRVGKDPEKGTIYPQFAPPQGFSPAATRYVMRMGYSDRVFAAALVNMAVKGYLTITRNKADFVLTRKDSNDSKLTPGEKNIAKKLFSRGNRIELKQKNHSVISAAISALKQSLKRDFEKLHFRRNSGKMLPGVIITIAIIAAIVMTSQVRAGAAFMSVWLSGWTAGTSFLVYRVIQAWRTAANTRGSGKSKTLAALGTTLFALPFVGGELFGLAAMGFMASPLSVIIFIAAIFINILFYRLLKAPTILGRRMMDHIEGFKMYLETAEEERLDMMRSPQKTPELFEKFLPYALALDVENQWAEKFSAVLAAASSGDGYSPAWYTGTNWRSMGTTGLVSTLGSSFSGTISSSSMAPGSSSGSGGGGFSGGGGGGGGGGGW